MTPGKLYPAPVQLLPRDARDALIAASRVEQDKEESTRRVAAIDRAAVQARMKYPQFFQTETKE